MFHRNLFSYPRNVVRSYRETASLLRYQSREGKKREKGEEMEYNLNVAKLCG